MNQQHHTMLKNTAILTLILSTLGLAACQSNTANQATASHGHHGGSAHRGGMKPHDPARQQAARDWREQQRSACDGKREGENVTIQVGHKTLSGQCRLMFQRDPQNMQHPQTTSPHSQHTTMRRGTWQKGDRQAFQQICSGKAANQNVQLSLNDQRIDGTCQLRFQANRTTTT